MIKFSVRNKATGQITNSWLSSSGRDGSYYEPGFGKPERWVDEEELSARGEDVSQAVAEQFVGGPDEEKKQYKFLAEFEIIEEDVSAQLEQARVNAESLAYLASTDWYVIRNQEVGTAIPQEIRDLRAAARAAVVQ